MKGSKASARMVTVAPSEASGRARGLNNSIAEPKGPRLTESWNNGTQSATAPSIAHGKQCFYSHHSLHVFDFALSFMVSIPLQLTDTHRHREYEHRAADGSQNGDDGVQCDAIWELRLFRAVVMLQDCCDCNCWCSADEQCQCFGDPCVECDSVKPVCSRCLVRRRILISWQRSVIGGLYPAPRSSVDQRSFELL